MANETKKTKIVKKIDTTAEVVKEKAVKKVEAKIAPKKIVTTKVKNVMSSALKLRLIANMVRGMNAAKAIDVMKFLNKKGCLFIKKAIESAVANGKELYGLTAKDLKVTSISIDEDKGFKRFKIASRSRVARITRRRSIINLVLTEK